MTVKIPDILIRRLEEAGLSTRRFLKLDGKAAIEKDWPSKLYSSQNYEELLAEKLLQLFVNRLGAYATQNQDGSYIRHKQPLTLGLIRRHLSGEITIGSYQLSTDNTVKWLGFDLDPEHLLSPEGTARRLLGVCLQKIREVEKNGEVVERPRIWQNALVLEASRYQDPSYHIWVLFSLPVPAKVARWLGLRILELANLNPKQVEVFPKQCELTTDRPYGNFIKLPFGLHRSEGKWSCLLDFETFKPLPNEKLAEKFGISFSEADLMKIMSFEEKKHVQASFDLPKNYKPLPNVEENKVEKILAKYWRKGFRNRLEMAFLGWCLKNGVSYESAYRIVDAVTRLTEDEERASRLKLVKYHYHNRRSLGFKLKGFSGLVEVIREVAANDGKPS